MAHNINTDFGNVLDQLLSTLRSSILQEYQKAVLPDAGVAVQKSTHRGSIAEPACWPCSRDEVKIKFSDAADAEADSPLKPVPRLVSRTPNPDDTEPVAIDDSEVHAIDDSEVQGLRGISSVDDTRALSAPLEERPTESVEQTPIAQSGTELGCKPARAEVSCVLAPALR